MIFSKRSSSAARASGPWPGSTAEGPSARIRATASSQLRFAMRPSFMTGWPKIGKEPVMTVSPAQTTFSSGTWTVEASSVSASPIATSRRRWPPRSSSSVPSKATSGSAGSSPRAKPREARNAFCRGARSTM